MSAPDLHTKQNLPLFWCCKVKCWKGKQFQCCRGIYRPVIKENTAHVVAACQNNILLLWHDSKWHTIIFWFVISMKLNIGKKITGLEMKNLACFQLEELRFTGEVHCLQGCYRKQTGRGDIWTCLKCFCVTHTDLFTSKCYIMQWNFTNGNSTWSCKSIICKGITEHTCWSVCINSSDKILHVQW